MRTSPLSTTVAVLVALRSVLLSYLLFWVAYGSIISILLWSAMAILVGLAWVLIVLGILALCYLTWLGYNLSQTDPKLFDPDPETLERLRTDLEPPTSV